MLCLLLAGTALAADPAPEAPAPPAPDAPDAAFVPPVPTAPIAVTWPADFPAALDATPVAVDLEILVDEQGKVEEATVVAGVEPFASLALAAARAATFVPATENGEPVAVYLPLHLEFAPPPINVEGVVRKAGGSRAPAAGVAVTVAGRTVLTDGDGRFAFRGLPPGDHEVALRGEEVSAEPTRFALAPDEAVRLELWVRPERLDEGIVGTYRVEREEVLRRSLTAEEIRTTPGTMGDPLRAVANLPGAVRTPLDAGWLLIRGGDPRDSGVYVDGTRVPLIYHLGGFTSVVHPGFVERVDFYPGGQSARYGRATAGAVDLITRPRPEGLEVRAGTNIVQLGAYAAVPIGARAGVTAGFRRSYLDWVLGAVPGVTEEQAGIAPRFWDWQARADVGPFGVFGLGFVDTLDASTQEGYAASIALQSHRIHGDWRGRLAGKPVIVRPWASTQLDRLTIEVLDKRDVVATWATGGRAELADDGDGPWGWSAGVDASFDRVALDYQHVYVRYGTVSTPDAYADVRLGDRVRVVLGARLDTLTVSGQVPRAELSPRAAATVPLTDWLTLVADGGLYHQPPSSGLLVGTPEGSALPLERSYGAGVGARVRFGPWSFDVDTYNRRMDHIAVYEADESLGQALGAAYGVETMARYDGRRAAAWVTAAWSRSLRREEAFEGWSFGPYDQPITVNTVGTVDLGRNWTVASRWRYASGFPVAGNDPTAYDVFTSTSVPLEGDRTEPFHALDLKISKQGVWRAWHLDAYLDVQNVYNRRVAEPVISGIWEVYGTRTYGFGLPVLPILGVEGVFGAQER